MHPLLEILLCLCLGSIPFVIKRNWNVPNFLVGVFFIMTYTAFRHFYAPWAAFGFLHIYGMIASFIMPVALAYLCKGTNRAKTVAIIMSVMVLLSPLSRPIILPRTEELTSINAWTMAIPLNLCNISALIYIVGTLTKSKVIKNYMILFGLFGGIANNMQVRFRETFWTYFTAESYFMHALLIIIPIFMLLTDQIQPEGKKAWLNAAYLLPFYIIMGAVLNPLWKTNFLFTAVSTSTYGGFIPRLSSPLHIFGAAVDPLYMACFCAAICLGVVAVYWMSVLIYKRLRPVLAGKTVETYRDNILVIKNA